jgi:hypothetical protein
MQFEIIYELRKNEDSANLIAEYLALQIQDLLKLKVLQNQSMLHNIRTVGQLLLPNF